MASALRFTFSPTLVPQADPARALELYKNYIKMYHQIYTDTGILGSPKKLMQLQKEIERLDPGVGYDFNPTFVPDRAVVTVSPQWMRIPPLSKKQLKSLGLNSLAEKPKFEESLLDFFNKYSTKSAVIKTKMSTTGGNHTCRLIRCHVGIGKGVAENQQEATEQAYQNAIERLKKTFENFKEEEHK